jgi:hypothetical protein
MPLVEHRADDVIQISDDVASVAEQSLWSRLPTQSTHKRYERTDTLGSKSWRFSVQPEDCVQEALTTHGCPGDAQRTMDSVGPGQVTDIQPETIPE